MTEDTNTVDDRQEATMTINPDASGGEEHLTAPAADEDLEPQMILTLTRTWKKNSGGSAVLELFAFLENGEEIFIQQEVDPEESSKRLNDLMDDEQCDAWMRVIHKFMGIPEF